MNFSNESVLITGGAGFIGCNLVHKLLNTDVEIIYVIDDLSSGNKKFLPNDKRIVFIHCDISNLEKYECVFPKNIDYIFHLAAHFANQNSVDYPLSDTKTNVIGTLNTLTISKKYDIKKIIYSSSSCVYGNSSFMSETHNTYPIETPYAISKLTGEMYVSFFSNFYDIPAISVRIFNTYGPFEISGKYRNVIPKFIENALLGKPIMITGTGEETRDFTFIDDTLDLFFLIANNSLETSGVYNAGTGNSVTIKHLAECILDVCESKSEIVYKEKRNWDEVEKRVSDTTKSFNTFGYESKTSLKDGLKKTVEWYRRTLDE